MENRIIKFRAWDKDNNCMVQLGRVDNNYDFEDGNVLAFAVDSYRNFGSHEFNENRKVDWDIMQFTGLLDKNGKEIYEGDIVNTYFMQGKEWVKFPDGTGFVYFDTENDYRYRVRTNSNFNPVFEIHNRTFEVIGNIHENPDLLK